MRGTFMKDLRFKLLTTSFIFLLILGVPQVAEGANAPQKSIYLNAPQVSGELLSYNMTSQFDSSSSQKNLPLIVVGDNQISAAWEKVPKINIEAFGVSGSISSVFDQNFVYFRIAFDENIPWIAIQWDADNSTDPENFKSSDMKPMSIGDDMWVFGSADKTKVLGDTTPIGTEPPFIVQDKIQDLYWEEVLLNDTSGKVLGYVIEAKRALVTNDKEGSDVKFSPNYNVSMYFASQVHHRPDSSLSYAKFALSSLKYGGAINTSITSIASEPLKYNVDIYLFYNVSVGLMIGSILFFTVITISVYLIKKEEL